MNEQELNDLRQIVSSLVNLDTTETLFFRQSVVLFKLGDRWHLIACAVERLVAGAPIPQLRGTKKYSNVILFEDFLTAQQCLKFVNSIGAPYVYMDDIAISLKEHKNWQSEHVLFDNEHMENSGKVFRVATSSPTMSFASDSLVSPVLPYFPNVYEAARYWMPFPKWHGSSDSRIGEIVFLFQEERVYIKNLFFLNETTLNIEIGGSEIFDHMLIIKGAYWKNNSMFQIESEVLDLNIELSIPHDCERLECYLLDSDGNVYGYHKEDKHSPTKHVIGTFQLKEEGLSEKVTLAMSEGEGQYIEFKPFVDLVQKQKSVEHKTKFSEIVMSVVAFSNAFGGSIFLGIADDCTIPENNFELQKIVKAEINDAVISRYLGELQNRIKSSIEGEVNLELNHVKMGDAVIVIIDVFRPLKVPISPNQDFHLYRRVGASNRKISPDQWARIYSQKM